MRFIIGVGLAAAAVTSLAIGAATCTRRKPRQDRLPLEARRREQRDPRRQRRRRCAHAPDAEPRVGLQPDLVGRRDEGRLREQPSRQCATPGRLGHLRDAVRRPRRPRAHVLERVRRRSRLVASEQARLRERADREQRDLEHLLEREQRAPADRLAGIRRRSGMVARRHEDRVHHRARQRRSRDLRHERRRLGRDTADEHARASTRTRAGRRTAGGSPTSRHATGISRSTQ